MTTFFTTIGQRIGDSSMHPDAHFPPFILLLGLLAVVLAICGIWKTFQKAGRPGWAAIVPFYSGWVLAETAGLSGWLGIVTVAVGIIPIVGWLATAVLSGYIAINLGRKFQKDVVFSLFLLWLIAPIGYLILGFGDATYHSEDMDDHQGFGGPTPPTSGL